MVFVPGNPLDSEDERMRRMEARDFASSRRWVAIFIGGLAILAIFGILSLLGLPGLGIALVPIGLGMAVGAGLQLLVDRISG